MNENDTKMIRFIDSEYNTLFYLPDGANVALTRANGEKDIKLCKHIDDYHMKVGYNVYHICEFAERMEANGTQYAPELPPELPERCYSVLPSTGELICINKNEKGYIECKGCSNDPIQNRKVATDSNLSHRVVPQQEAAMLGGALHGWKSVAARTTSYDIHGNPVTPIKKRAAKSKQQER